MEKAKKLAGENDLGTLQEAKEKSGTGGALSASGEGEGNEKAEEIAKDNDKEVIEKAVEIKQQEEAQKQQQAQQGQQAQQQNAVNLTPDAKNLMGGGAGAPGGGTPVPQANALRTSAFG